MSYSIRKLEVWAADVMNRPEKLARVLEALAAAGANIEFMIARRVTEDTSRVFLSPITGKKAKQAALDVGLVQTAGMHTIRVEGPDRPGLGADLTRAVAAAGVNIRGASAASIGKKNVFYFAFKTEPELAEAVKALKKKLTGKKK